MELTFPSLLPLALMVKLMLSWDARFMGVLGLHTSQVFHVHQHHNLVSHSYNNNPLMVFFNVQVLLEARKNTTERQKHVKGWSSSNRNSGASSDGSY